MVRWFLKQSNSRYCFLFILCFYSELSFAGSLGSYFSNYKVGANLIQNSDRVQFSYDLEAGESDSSRFCQSSEQQVRTCQHITGQSSQGIGSGYLNGFGIFLQQPFKRQGFWYFDADLAIGAVILSGELAAGNRNSHLTEMSYSIYGARLNPYLQFGMTPANWFPDILVSAGPVFNIMAGNVSVNGQNQATFFLQGSELFSGLNPLSYAFVGLELVFYRFGHGAFSFYSLHSNTDRNKTGGDFYSGSLDGMTNFQAAFNNSESGFKLLFNWP
jgi:hypothetical protein